jgi:light-regulated signal transduction histidine kinase (bacteriophytochrome)
VLVGPQPVGTLRLVAGLAELLRRLQVFVLVLVLAAVGAALGSMILLSSLQRLVSRPILELADTATQVSLHRNYALRARPRTRDEVGVAVEAFNHMLQRIEDADRELRAFNATLEQRVAERTADAEERAAALRRSNQELERFAYVASHDLKEPLRAISSYAQLIARGLDVGASADLVLYAQHLTTGATRLQHLINDLLDYARVGKEARSFDGVPVPIDAALDTVLTDLRQIIAENSAQIRRGPLPVVEGDPWQLGQLLQNLIANAIAFRGEAAPRIEVRAELVGQLWRFSVRDNGIGIETRYHERIFEIFQRLHGRERPGTGIGLAICKRIVEGHGGTIGVDSQPGQGATFWFTLPERLDAPADKAPLAMR